MHSSNFPSTERNAGSYAVIVGLLNLAAILGNSLKYASFCSKLSAKLTNLFYFLNAWKMSSLLVLELEVHKLDAIRQFS